MRAAAIGGRGLAAANRLLRVFGLVLRSRAAVVEATVIERALALGHHEVVVVAAHVDPLRRLSRHEFAAITHGNAALIYGLVP